MTSSVCLPQSRTRRHPEAARPPGSSFHRVAFVLATVLVVVPAAAQTAPIPVDASAEATIAQVAGRQIRTGGRSGSTSGGGLFRGLFGGGSADSGGDDDEYRKVTPVPSDEPADWSGVPYHTAGGATPPSRSPQPIRDSKVIRRERTTGDSTSTRSSVPQPPTTSRPREFAVPTPPPSDQFRVNTADEGPRVIGRRAPQPIAASGSSRRQVDDGPSVSARQSVRTVPEAVSRVETGDAAASGEPVVELIPKVSRRRVVAAAPAAAPAPAPAEEAPLPAVPSSRRSVAATTPTPTATTDDSSRPTAIAQTPSAVAAAPQPVDPEPAAAEAEAPRAFAAAPAPTSPPSGTLSRVPRRDLSPAPAATKIDTPAAADTGFVARGTVPPSAPTFQPAVPNFGVAAMATAAVKPKSVNDSLAAAPASVRPLASLNVESVPPATSAGTTMIDGHEVHSIENQNLSADAGVAPGLHVSAVGPARVVVGQTYPYTIRIENAGKVAANGVVVQIDPADWARIVGSRAGNGTVTDVTKTGQPILWQIEDIDVAGATELQLLIQARRGGTHELDLAWTLQPRPQQLTVEVTEPKLAVEITGPDEVVYGQSKTYRIRVLNPGDGPAGNVVFTLSPESPGAQSQPIGNIPAGREAQFEVELTAQDRGELKIHGIAAGDLDLTAQTEKIVQVLVANLHAELSGPEVRYQNKPADYQLTISNDGTAASGDVQVTLDLPAGVDYLGGLDDASVAGRRLTWSIAELGIGKKRSYSFRCQLTESGRQQFNVAATGSALGQTAVSLATDVQAIADLVLSVEDPAAPAPTGRKVRYDLVIRNRGSLPANAVAAVAQFSHGIEPQSIVGHPGRVVPGQVLIEPIDEIAPGQEVRIGIEAVAAEPGNHRFRAEVRSGDTVLVAEEATRFMVISDQRISRRSDPVSTTVPGDAPAGSPGQGMAFPVR